MGKKLRKEVKEAEKKIYIILNEYECSAQEVWLLGSSLINEASIAFLEKVPAKKLKQLKKDLLESIKDTAKLLSKKIGSYENS